MRIHSAKTKGTQDKSMVKPPGQFMALKTQRDKIGWARFPEILQNFSEHQILWSLCLVVFRALTLKLPIQTSLSVVPKLPVSLSSAEIVTNSGKRAHSWVM